jgi:cytochrome c oxidase assembly protein subunit 15
VVAVYFLILVGGVVRSTGSGMGCPDWPKCFGTWIPPTVESELPANYKVIYKEHLTKYGETFNVTKTWTEYLNRLFGVLTGFFILISALVSIKLRKTHPLVTTFTWIGLLLVVFQGWLGGKVVHSNLSHSMVTYHFMIAFLIIAVFTFCYIQLNVSKLDFSKQQNKKLDYLGYFLMMLLLAQIVLGTKVRTEIDVLASQIDTLQRADFAEAAKNNFPWHRTLSLLFTITLVVYFYIKSKSKLLKINVVGCADFILLYSTLSQMVIGTILYKFGFPYWAQPLHIILSSFLFGALSYTILEQVSKNLSKSKQSDVILQSI